MVLHVVIEQSDGPKVQNEEVGPENLEESPTLTYAN